MIALSYYLASSIEKYTKINEFNQVIFVIDDPVSSVSYGNFFGICNLLKNFDNTIIKILKWEDINIQKNRQKIILTHNTQFLNTLVNNVFNEKSLYFLLTPQ
ncbi:MAG: AAA family ATPase [Candidatus Peribacteria bacterium]|jgi:wobble nucleotide-excising tRNase|nr:AAA family ATPase [Candidatus Peribacteria bacterium]